MITEKYSPFRVSELLLIRPPVVPMDLRPLVNRLFNIARFVDTRYPAGIFNDNVGDHTFRLIAMTGTLKTSGLDSSRLSRMLWIHDIPELVTGEYIAPLKESDAVLAARLQQQEAAAAAKLLSPSDTALLVDFNSSSSFLKGENIDVSTLSAEGLTAGILDKIDGNMFFHWSLAHWIAQGHPSSSVGRTGLQYTFNQKQLFEKSLTSLPPAWSSICRICTRLLDIQVGYITDCWGDVPPSRIPPPIRSQLHLLNRSS